MNTSKPRSKQSLSWQAYASLEGGMKALSAWLQKPLGQQAASLEGVALGTVIIGAVQMISGLAFSKFRLQTLVADGWRKILGSLIFGVFATIMTVVGILALKYPGADVGVKTFIISLSIIPGIFADRFLFGDRLSARQLLGVAVFLFAGWAMFNFPSLSFFLHLPTWVLLCLALPLLAVANETIARKVSAASTHANNFWVGLTTVVCASTVLVYTDGWGNAAQYSGAFYFLSFAIGGVVFTMIAFKLLSYRVGGQIVIKKMVMKTTYLLLATFGGVLFLGESFTVGKIIGITLYVLALILTDPKLWQEAIRAA